MASYIDKSKITKAYPADDDDSYNDGVDVMYKLVMGTPKADVVERSKIDKDFGEIEKLVTESMRVAPWEDKYRSGLRKAMAIIERNIEEE